MALRVVSGSAGGLHLRVPKGVEIRPTQDRIKQAIFSSLGERVIGAQVLDLYAGTGALGIEALSRGAAGAVFVEKNRTCLESIRENLQHCRLTGTVVQSDASRFLTRPNLYLDRKFDLIFGDPPYDKSRGEWRAEELKKMVIPHLSAGGCLIWEYFSGQKLLESKEIEIKFDRHYGETAVTILSFRH